MFICAAEADVYLWPAGGETVSCLTFTPQASFSLTVTGRKMNGCTNTATATQRVELCTDVSDHASLNSQLLVYPNPARDQLNVVLPAQTEIIITDLFGTIVYTGPGAAGLNTISISRFPCGIYFFKANAGGQPIKIVKNQGF